MTNDETTIEAGRLFCEEAEHLRTANMLRAMGNHEDARGMQETADMCLDLAWEMLDSIPGWRPRDVAAFRHAMHQNYTNTYHGEE